MLFIRKRGGRLIKLRNKIMSNEVAKTIFSQLGGGMFVAMTGAKNLVTSIDTMSMQLGRGTKNKCSHMSVTLAGDDTYTVVFSKWNGRKLEMKEISKHTGIYFDMLRDLFTQETGFYTSLR